ncbi:hypothetical protein LCGC14_1605500 [marine sediment metagenome]|uniref:Portal protein n=1 Tax=marine sediment metagenome TaxID=412755 RepID=A0A0F9KQL2_9ZZZZ
MGLGSAADEVKKVTALTTRTQSLRDRWDWDFRLFTLDPAMYEIPESEGIWFKAIVNNAATDGNRMIDLLATAHETLKIAITDEKMKERDDLTATEHAAIGLLHLADMINEDDPEASTIRGQGAAYAVLRGWTAYRALLRENDDGVFPDIKVWDPRNVYWIYGLNRLTWVCNVRYSSPQEVRDEYPGWNGGSQDKIGEDLVKIFDIWAVKDDKPAEEGVAINGEWVKEPQTVKVGGKPLFYIPVRIKSGRSLPLIRSVSQNPTANSTTSMESIKHVGEGFLANVRDILPIESRLFSYRMERAGQLAKSPNMVEFDGAKSQNKPPDGFEKDPYLKGRTIFLDTSLGEKLAERMTPADGNEIDLASGQAAAMRTTGTGLSPVAFGLGPFPSTAQGTDIINHNILDSIKPFQLLLQSDRVWQAEQMITQYKHGGFSNQDFEGYDFRGVRFKAKVKANDIDENYKFKDELSLDLVRDENLHVGMAVAEVGAGLLSKQSARDQHNLADDPDNEQEIIDRETATQIPEMAFLKVAKELWDDSKDGEFGRVQAVLLFQKAMETLQPQALEGGQGAGGNAGVMNPSATAGAARNTSRTAQPVVPGPVRKAAQERGQ